MSDGTISWREVMAETTARLAAVSDVPGVEARWIVERASGSEGAELVAALDEPATRRAMHFHDLMVERRLRGEPLQYVLGRWGFRSLDLLVDHRVLIPRPETEVVAGLAIAELQRRRIAAGDRRLRALDLGTGSGAIGLSIAAECERVEVWLTDRSPDALAVARANLAGLGRAATRVTIVEGSWFAPLDESLVGSFDVIVSNPPYVATDDEVEPIVRDWEPHDALHAGEDGLDDLRVLVSGAPRWLVPGGALVLEMDPRQTATVVALADDAGFVDAEVHRDLAGRDRVVVARTAATA